MRLILLFTAIALFASCKEDESKPEPIEIQVEVNDVKINGHADGSIIATVTGGVEPYAYLWSNGATSKDLIDVIAGTYSLTVTDASNVIASISGEISEPTALVATFTKKNATSETNSNGKITVSVSGGVEPYTVSWNNGLTVLEADNLAAGQYLIEVKDANQATVNLDITISYPLKITLTSTNATTYNGTNGSITIADNGGGTPPFTYAWSDGNTDKERTAMKAGYYTVTITDAEAKSVNSSVTVYENYDQSQPMASLVSKITRFDQSGIRIDNDGQIIYIDPAYVPAGYSSDADVILITHGHEDHFSVSSINKLKKATTIFAVTSDLYNTTVNQAEASRVFKIAPDSVLEIDGTHIDVVKAYNSNHQLPNSVGYIVTVDGKKLYHTGDTKRIPEMTSYACDIVFLPMGQTYTFATLTEAKGAATDCGATVVIPIHYGLYEGKMSDPWSMKEMLDGTIPVCTLMPVK